MPKKKSPGMPVQKILRKIRPEWIKHVGRDLARGMDVRAGFEQQLDRFFDLLEQSVTTGDPAWMDSILLDWAKSSTETNLEEGLYHVSFIINRMIALTIQVANETLTKQQSIDLLAAIIPVYTYGLGVVARYEMETRVAHISDEMQRVQKQLERIDRSKSAFISVAAHELKTPLTLIEGYASMMDDLARDARDSGMGKLLAGVNIGIGRLRAIIDDMIDVSMIDNNLLRLNFQPAQVGQIVDVLRKEAEPVMQSRRLQIDATEFEGSRQWIYVDTQRITQALRNVINNAVKYTPDNGKITISGRMLPGFIEIVVEDTGIGISQEHQSIIFEKFGQVGSVGLHSSGKTKFKGGGPGLGLSITRGILEAHGGAIWVESPGYDEKAYPGSTFHILIPARTESADPEMSRLFDTLEKKFKPNVETNTSTHNTAS
ncbi:MAG: HAMP domain-containing histidine kinase [Anaerolineae bacterium]|nr:HAMP domain-containing histidine kinase [Anaerolineae bacterium]MBL8105284.1 HAMP domain-containing histidine kinase [Anaerolineales bacterium]MCC7187709.1 HAMP domain-containing histidine kinase [Anaerolineales bacterium]